MNRRRPERIKLAVAAIDFGTTFSGWSLLLAHQYHGSDPTKVIAKNWNNGSNLSSKTPTTILIDPNGKNMVHFGYNAENRYAQLASENKHQAYYYFKRFKMKLYKCHQGRLTRDMQLEDENGKTLPALRVFSLSIRFLHDDVLRECKDKYHPGGMDEDDIMWVITVPTIWDAAAKQFMREAANEAGIPTNQLIIALEPETASLYCKYMHTSMEDLISPGSTYIVMDAGGGTVDVTVHEVLSDESLRELHSANGGAWGGTMVDDTFSQFLIKIFGAPLWKSFKTEHMDDYIEIMREFEVKKRDVSCGDAFAVFRLTATLMDIFKTKTGESIENTIQQMNLREKVTVLPGNKLRLHADCMRGFFDPALKSITEHMAELVKHPAVRETKMLLMVGGFSQSPYLKERLEKKFPWMRIIVPPEADLAVLKGAAIYGHREDAISERVSKYTYGFTGCARFKDGVHPEKCATFIRGRKRAEGAFYKLVEIGERLKIDERREWKKKRTPLNENGIIFPLYGSFEKNPEGEWSDHTFHIGNLTVSMTNTDVPISQRKFRICGIFGKTEIEFQALELGTGKLTSATFDAL